MDTEIVTSIFELEYYHNSLKAWLVAFCVVLAAHLTMWLAIKVIRGRLHALAKRTTTHFDDFIADLIKSTNFFFYLAISLFAGSLFLELPQGPRHIMNALPVLALVGQFAFWGNRLVDFWLNRYAEAKENEQERLVVKTMLGPVKFLVLLLLWSLLLLVAMDNLGIDVTALVAGLGVGGVAIALATQNILGDLFASLSIVLEKPFVIGDFIIVGDFLGTVEHIGLKTTRIRSLTGEQIIFSNNDILQSRIRNYKRMYERRIVFQFRVIYQTPLEQLQEIPGMIKDIVCACKLTRFDRAHFFRYGDSSLDFEVVYYVLAPEYNTYMDIQQQINFEIYRQFKEKGIVFAHPTQTLYLANKTPDAQIGAPTSSD